MRSAYLLALLTYFTYLFYLLKHPLLTLLTYLPTYLLAYLLTYLREASRFASTPQRTVAKLSLESTSSAPG